MNSAFRTLLCWLALSFMGDVGAAEPPPAPTTFYVQVIRGTDNGTPEKNSWKPVGPKLSKALSPVFKWQHYWQVDVQQVQVSAAGTVAVKVSPEREVKVEMLADGRPEVRLYRKGELRRKVRFNGDDHMTIMGGESVDRDGWFVVVRRDKPSVE
jgi:hypothetical protein